MSHIHPSAISTRRKILLSGTVHEMAREPFTRWPRKVSRHCAEPVCRNPGTGLTIPPTATCVSQRKKELS